MTDPHGDEETRDPRETQGTPWCAQASSTLNAGSLKRPLGYFWARNIAELSRPLSGAPVHSSPLCSISNLAHPRPSTGILLYFYNTVHPCTPAPPTPSSCPVLRTNSTSSRRWGKNSATSAAGSDPSEFPPSTHCGISRALMRQTRYATAVFIAYVQNKLAKGRTRFEVGLKLQDLERGVRPGDPRHLPSS